MSDSEKPTFLGLEGMLQDLGANSAKAKSAPPPAPASTDADEIEPPTLDPPTLDRKKTARETPVATSPKPPPLPLFAYGSRTSPTPPVVEEASPSSARRQLDRGDPVTAVEPYADVQDEPTIEPAPPTEMSPSTQPVTSLDLEKEGPKSELAKTRVSAAISVPPSDKPSDSKPEPSIPVALVKDAEKAPETPKKSEPEKKPIVSAREALEGGPKNAKREADPAGARFPTLKALDADADKPKSGIWFALAAILVAGGLGWYFTHNRFGGAEPARPTDTATPSAATSAAPPTASSVHAVTSAPPASGSAVATASAAPSASVAPSTTASAAAPPSVATTATGGGTHTTAATTTHATSRPTATPTAPATTAPPPATTPTATTPPPPPTSTKPSLINEP